MLHVALRQPPGAAVGGAEIEKTVLTERERMLDFAAGRARRPHHGQCRRALPAGRQHRHRRLGPGAGHGGAGAARLHRRRAALEFVSNVDGCHLAEVLESADPTTTLFIVSSKTFTTLETQTNARSCARLARATLGEQAVPQHFAAVSVNHQAMDAFGVHPDYRFQMWDWVGGRYSIWSSIGVSLAIAIGEQNFLDFLAGGHAMDEHFRTTAWADNLPVLMGLIGVWNINFWTLPTLAVLPYDDSLRRFSAYLQQLEMESNGKSVMLDGTPVECQTAAVIWGEPGNNAQHSFFQLLHQGTPRAALDFLLPVSSSCGEPGAAEPGDRQLLGAGAGVHGGPERPDGQGAA